LKREPASIHPAAVREAEAAIEWYQQRSERAAERFVQELTEMIRRIEREPDRFPIFHFGTRRAALRRFPYLLVFHETATRVEIIAVAHGRRRPGYWQERLG
jgi:plasmid stabilization system protein ParE